MQKITLKTIQNNTDILWIGTRDELCTKILLTLLPLKPNPGEAPSADYQQLMITAMREAPRHPVVLYHFGEMLRDLGHYDLAAKAYGRLIAFHPEDPFVKDAHFGRLRTLPDPVDVITAADAFLAMPDAEPSDRAVAFNKRAKAHNAVGNHTAAIADSTEVLSMPRWGVDSEERRRALSSRAIGYHYTKQFHAVVQDVDRMLRSTTIPVRTKATGYALRGEAHLGIGDAAAACADAYHLLALEGIVNRDRAFAYAILSKAHRSTGDYTAAVASADRMLALDGLDEANIRIGTALKAKALSSPQIG